METNKTYLLVSALLFDLVGIFQATRAVLEWPVLINGYAVPVAFSYGAALVMIALGAWGFAAWRRA